MTIDPNIRESQINILNRALCKNPNETQFSEAKLSDLRRDI